MFASQTGDHQLSTLLLQMTQAARRLLIGPFIPLEPVSPGEVCVCWRGEGGGDSKQLVLGLMCAAAAF